MRAVFDKSVGICTTSFNSYAKFEESYKPRVKAVLVRGTVASTYLSCSIECVREKTDSSGQKTNHVAIIFLASNQYKKASRIALNVEIITRAPVGITIAICEFVQILFLDCRNGLEAS